MKMKTEQRVAELAVIDGVRPSLAAPAQHRRAQQQQVVATLGLRALADVPLDELLAEATAQVCQTLGTQLCKVLELSPDGETLVLRAGVGWQAGRVGHATMPANENSQASYTLRVDKPVVVEDLSREQRFHAPALLGEHNVVSGMSVIIRGVARPYGVLGTHSTQRRTFTQDDAHFLQAVANLLAQAIVRQQAQAALQKSEAQLRLIMDNVPALISYINTKERYEFANASYESWLGLRPAAIVGRRIAEVIGEAAYAHAQPHIRAALAGQRTTYESEMLYQDGTIHTVIATYAPDVAPDGQVAGFYAVLTDITKRKRAEERFRQVVEQAPNGMIMIDGEGTMVLVNTQIEATFGYSRDELLGQSIDLLAPISSCAAHAVYRQGYLNDPTARPMGAGRDLFGLRKDGAEFPVEIGLTPLATEQGMMVLATIVDISERKQAEEKQHQLFRQVEQQRAKLRTLNKTLATAQETERKELAHELHDRVGQNLTALNLTLKLIQTQLAVTLAKLDPVHAHLKEARTLVEQLTEQVRDVMADLQPPMLSDYGLPATLKWYATQVARRTGLAITVEVDAAAGRLAEDAELNLFRIVQEALNNVVKHAQATQATVTLAAKDQKIRLTVTDNGRGMMPTLETDPAQGWGMLTMRERALAFGGRFWIKSGPDQGTTIGVEVER